jgi:hypothetical protein
VQSAHGREVHARGAVLDEPDEASGNLAASLPSLPLGSSVGIDLFLHGGLLARPYVEPSPFLLPAEDAFRRIPLGYLTFLILTIGLFWLLRRLHVRGVAAGFRAVAGAVVWGALVLGLYSFSTASQSLLIGWGSAKVWSWRSPGAVADMAPSNESGLWWALRLLPLP